MSVIPSYLSVLKLQSYSSQCTSCAFFREIDKVDLRHEAVNESSATNFIMNLSHTLYAIADAEALCSNRYLSGSIQIKCCWGPWEPPPPYPLISVTLSKSVKTSVSTGVKKKVMKDIFLKLMFNILKNYLNFIMISRIYLRE